MHRSLLREYAASAAKHIGWTERIFQAPQLKLSLNTFFANFVESLFPDVR